MLVVWLVGIIPTICSANDVLFQLTTLLIFISFKGTMGSN